MRVSRARRPPRFYDPNVSAAALGASRADADHGLSVQGGVPAWVGRRSIDSVALEL